MEGRGRQGKAQVGTDIPRKAQTCPGIPERQRRTKESKARPRVLRIATE